MIATLHSMAALPDEETQTRRRFERAVVVRHAASVVMLAALAIAAYATLLRTMHLHAADAAAVRLTQRQSVLAERIANAASQYAMGDRAAAADLEGDTAEFESAHWRAIAGQPTGGIAPVVGDAALQALYFDGSGAIDAAATQLATRARRIAHDPAGSAAARAQSSAMYGLARAISARLRDVDRIRTDRTEREANELRLTGAATCGGLLFLLALATLSIFRPMARRIIGLGAELSEMSRQIATDPLTGTLNKRSFYARGEIEIQKARRYQRPVSLLVIDADQLPAIEAVYGIDGHHTVLRAVSSSITDGTRVSDLIARIDAEQFAVLLPETNTAGAELLAERLRRKIGALTVPINDDVVSCTVSVGVASAEKNASFLWSTFKRADQALYEAKARGRNQVVVAAAA